MHNMTTNGRFILSYQFWGYTRLIGIGDCISVDVDVFYLFIDLSEQPCGKDFFLLIVFSVCTI